MRSEIDGLLKSVDSWASFKTAISGSNTKIKGDAFELLTKKYLQTDPVYATKIKTVWLLNELPATIRKKLNLPATDQGIDLIAETAEGDYWAVQCKYREDETHNLTWREIATFTGLAFGVCNNISYGLICTSGDRYASLLKTQDNVGVCSNEVWQALDNEVFKSLGSPEPLAKLEPKKPRPHQQVAIDKATSYYKEPTNDRGKLIMPCGAGKSLTAHWIAQSLAASTIIIAVPSLALLRQTYRVWLTEYLAQNEAKGLEWLCVCSDSSIGDPTNDDLAVLPQDLGVPCYTNEQEISDWFAKTAGAKTRIIFTTYQSGKVIAQASKKAGIIYDFGVMDEAHKTVGQKDALFSHLLFDTNIDIKKRMFMTATERRYIGKSDEIVSMDNEEIYGEAFEVLSFKSALEQQPAILSDYKILTIFVSKAELLELVEKNKFVKPVGARVWDKEVEAELLLSLVALKKAQLDYPIGHTVSFHSSIARAEAFKKNADIISAEFPDTARLNTYHVSGATPTSVRQRQLNEFADTPNSLITNARCLTEGVDVPNIDCVMFADPRRSAVDIVQAVGRALRPSNGKDFGYVLVPVMVDQLGDEFSIDELNVYAPILAVLRALASNDERIIEQFKSVSEGRQRSNGPIIDPVFTAKVAESIDLTKFVTAVEIQCWNKLAKLSWRPFSDAREYAQSLGLKSSNEWRQHCRDKAKPPDIPVKPEAAYIGEWISWGDWLGNDNIRSGSIEYLPFTEARDYARSLSLKNIDEWRAFCHGELKGLPEKPINIPTHPSSVYRSDWLGNKDWLGTEYLSFDKGRAFARALHLKSQTEWIGYCKGLMPELNNKPVSIPSDPGAVYKSHWQGYGDWLGTGNVRPSDMKFRKFKDAKAFVHKLNFKGSSEWKQYCKSGHKPHDIPAAPNRTYSSEWQGMADWLGTQNKQAGSIGYVTYDEAKKFVKLLGLKSTADWKTYKEGKYLHLPQKPADIPSDPRSVYKEQFVSMGDWLGTGKAATFNRQYLQFQEAREFVRSLKIRNQTEWILYAKDQLPSKGAKPHNIPASPRSVYTNEWIGMSDWLGNGNARGEWRPFTEARTFARALGIKSAADWRDYIKSGYKPLDIPRTPYVAYEKEWMNWQDWLGTQTVTAGSIEWMDFDKARDFVRSLGLKNMNKEWRKYIDGGYKDLPPKPNNIPKDPRQVYGAKYLGNADWLGTGQHSPGSIQWLPFEQARTFVKTLGLTTQTEWESYRKGNLPHLPPKPYNIPNSPQQAYRQHWIKWAHWLGKEN